MHVGVADLKRDKTTQLLRQHHVHHRVSKGKRFGMMCRFAAVEILVRLLNALTHMPSRLSTASVSTVSQKKHCVDHYRPVTAVTTSSQSSNRLTKSHA